MPSDIHIQLKNKQETGEKAEGASGKQAGASKFANTFSGYFAPWRACLTNLQVPGFLKSPMKGKDRAAKPNNQFFAAKARCGGKKTLSRIWISTILLTLYPNFVAQVQITGYLRGHMKLKCILGGLKIGSRDKLSRIGGFAVSSRTGPRLTWPGTWTWATIIHVLVG
jgi:hypothetical protein